MAEFDWIARYFAPLTAGDPHAFALTDDGALLAPAANHALIVTTDALVESVHFLPHTPPDLLARKCLAVNLSDLAAMGATPYAYSLALCLPPATHETWIADFAHGLQAMQQRYGLHLLGGDTTSSATLSIVITAYGQCPHHAVLRRNGAQVGDILYVTGTLGDAAAGLKLAQDGQTDHPLAQRYLLPTPRVATGIALRGLASACMDISDGLLQDAEHIASASNVHLHIKRAALPLSVSLQHYAESTGCDLDAMISAGDDYELLFTAPPRQASAIAALATQTGVAITAIGTVASGYGVTLEDEQGNVLTLSQQGWQHF